MLLSAITMVKNEEEFIGYTLMAMYPYVEEILVVDGGSEDNTKGIIQHVMKNLDFQKKITFWEDFRPKNELIHTRNDMVARCQGKWILRLEGDEVYSDDNAKRVRTYVENGRIKDKALCIGWPYYFFVNDIKTIVPIGQDHTFATIMIKNHAGIRADHHAKGGNETFYDEGWFDSEGKNVSIWHPKDNPCQRVHGIAIHHYAGFKAATRHNTYIQNCAKTPFSKGHPEVFLRHDFKPLMHNSGSKEVVKAIEEKAGMKYTFFDKLKRVIIT